MYYIICHFLVCVTARACFYPSFCSIFLFCHQSLPVALSSYFILYSLSMLIPYFLIYHDQCGCVWDSIILYYLISNLFMWLATQFNRELQPDPRPWLFCVLIWYKYLLYLYQICYINLNYIILIKSASDIFLMFY